MKKYLLVLGLCSLNYACALAQIQHISGVTPHPARYQKTEFNIQLNERWQNPYQQEDVALDMLLTSPSGKKLALPCYYESGESGRMSLWKARFAPQEKGRYQYRFQLTKAGKVVSVSPKAIFAVAASAKGGFLHAGSNWTLQFDNGKPFRGIGENVAWESRIHDDSKYLSKLHEQPKYSYDYMLRALAQHGGNFYRTWICPWNLPLDWQKDFNNNRYTPADAYYNPSAIQRIDHVVQLSDSLGLYMMLTLGPGNYQLNSGGFASTAADFFVNPLSKMCYKNRLRYIVARWGYNTSIAAWEFFNEVDNVQFGDKNHPISADAITQWHDEMSNYLQQIDPYHHLITTSISHRDVKGMNTLPAIDINQKHIYKNTAVIPATINEYEDRFHKPYVIGEYSYEWDWAKNFDDFASEMDSDYKRGLWYGLFSPTPILPMSWWWEYFDNRGTDAYLSRIRFISTRMLNAGKGSFQQINLPHVQPGITTLAVRCGTEKFIYVYNATSQGQQLAMPPDIGLNARSKVQLYQCDTGHLTPVQIKRVKGNGYMAPPLTLNPHSDVIYIIKI
ncbi:hypothetical protein GCM10027037_23490 [Mucilaginibacter koreensis]